MGRARRGVPDMPVEVRIAQLREDGRGLAEFRERPLLVSGALPGETVLVQIDARRRGAFEGRAIDVLDPAAHRVRPDCRYTERCGGCSMQHIALESQLAGKQEMLARLLREAEVVPQRWRAPERGPVRAYRRKARLGVRFVRGHDGVLVGFRERGSSRVTDAIRCDTLAAPVGELLGPLRDVIGELADPRSVPQVEVAIGDSAAALVLRHLEPFTDLDHSRLVEFAVAHGIALLGQSGGPGTVQPLPGLEAPALSYSLAEFDVDLAFEPLDFVQVNARMNEVLVRHAVDALALSGRESVLDLFCGIGNFTLPIARRAARVVGFEGSADLVARAGANAIRNGIGHAAFETRDLYAEGGVDAADLRGVDRVMLDPPRSGVGAALPALLASDATRIVYVACGPEAFARDLAQMTRAGFSVEEVGIFDMFPHTAHVESVGVLTR